MATDMRIGLALGYWGAGADDATEAVRAAEALGYDSVWTAEAYGSDAFTPLTWYGARTERIGLGTAIAQISARTPVATAMHALTLDHLSGGRLRLGIGVSGPQVVEGWYGRPFPRPLQRTREYLDIMRQVWRREAPVASAGPHYPLPLPGGSGLGRPLKSITRPLRPDIPVYLGAEGPRNVALAAEAADGWVPMFYHPGISPGLYADALAGAPEGFDIACTVSVLHARDTAAALRAAKAPIAFYIGGMGARSSNFHLDVFVRMGFEEEAHKVQELFLAGRRAEAVEAVPDELADGLTLAGPLPRIAERLAAWRASPVGTLLVAGVRDEPTLRALRDMVLG
ncbi:LLM class F420-dependent oxidoreductase [Nocardiopsis sp. CNT-189]|uniref:LLM class F420-dependent oxidoreductase n=1 Tax=Nocardiopsis oceanisediminis TaxID=2816862 RepID=UPI003B31DA44